jgi:uncharacterized membrane protein YtjA (UPF0391 family)
MAVSNNYPAPDTSETQRLELAFFVSPPTGTGKQGLARHRRTLPRGNGAAPNQTIGGDYMLYWAMVFLVVAIVAAIFGFGGIVSAAAGIAKILFFIFLILFIVSLFTGRRSRKSL